MRLLEDRVVVVTGAGRGIGRDHALALARYGAKVLVNDLGGELDGRGSSSSPADEVVAEIREAGGEALANYDDVTDFEASANLIRQAIDTWGKLDVLVNNAGILRDRISWNMTEEDWDLVMNVHMKGTFCCTRHALVHWRLLFKRDDQLQNARIINTVSGAMFGNVGQSNYGAAKAGIMGYTIGVALEAQQMGVTANAIRPGGQTRMSNAVPDDSALGARRKDRSERDTDLPDTFGSELVCYLASMHSGWISGQMLRVGENALEIDEGWQVAGMLPAPDGKQWTAEQLIAGLPKLVGTAPGSLVEFLDAQ